jgi:uncharacterized small protein (DUF1192 family)
MKKVFKKSEVAHIWANQLQEEGRNAGGNFYFNHQTIYSYGSHFPIAKHVVNKKSEKVVLFTTRTYSNTTAKHLSAVRGAISHLEVIHVFNPNGEPKENLEQFIRAIKNELSGLAKAKKPEKYIVPAKSVYFQLEAYCKFFGIKVPKEAIKLMASVETGAYTEYLQKEAKRIKAEMLKREAQKLKAFNIQLADWRAFEISEASMYGNILPHDFLRFNKTSKRVETSKGIEIPEAIAKRSFKWIKATIKAGGCDGQCEYKILDYSVKAVTPELVTIGCHKILVSEIEALAISLNW